MRPIHHVLLSLALVGSCGAAVAATPSATTGLGQAWPNATDVSVNPGFHAYRFDRQGVRYVQINDANGKVRGAVAYVGDQVLQLPIGSDAEHWQVVADGASATSGQTVYQDDAVTITADPQPTGVVVLSVTEPCNPLVCSVKGP